MVDDTRDTKSHYKEEAKKALNIAFSLPGMGVTVDKELAQSMGFFIDDAVLTDEENEAYAEFIVEETEYGDQ